MMFIQFVLVLLFVNGVSAFRPINGRTVVRSSLSMSMGSGMKAPPGMKPGPDGKFKKAGEHLAEYLLENENGSKALIRTYGCNAFSWTTADGTQVMGTRNDAPLGDKMDSKPHPGGAPHCFPQFGPGAILQHGFARGMKFIPEERAKKLSFDRMIFKLEPTEETLKIWNHNFEYRVDITLRDNSLEWDVIIINLDNEPWTCTTGLHNYFDVSSLSNVVISGPFAGADTVCKVTGATGKAPSNDVKVTTAIDMLYKKVTGPVTITDTGKKTKLTLERKGYSDTCIWSPFNHESWNYDKFICVEPVQVDPVTIPPGKFKETKFYQKVTFEKI